MKRFWNFLGLSAVALGLSAGFACSIPGADAPQANYVDDADADPAAYCGNVIVEPGESCDLGVDNDRNMGCSDDCLFEPIEPPALPPQPGDLV